MLKIKCDINQQYLKNSWPLFCQTGKFFTHLKFVDRVSETQLQVSENSDWIIWRLKGLDIYDDIKLKQNPLGSMVYTELSQRCKTKG